jgi:hypothetical protein
MAGFDPGVRITRELIADNPDAAMEHIHALVLQGQETGAVIADLQTRLQDAEDARHEMETRIAGQAEAERRAAQAGEENESLRNQLTDSHNQRTSLIAGQNEALQAYRDLLLSSNPQLPPSLISGGSLNEIQASVEAARGVVSHVQSALEASNNNSRLPAGAPMRTVTPDPGSMTASEKIVYGIRQAKGEELMTG